MPQITVGILTHNRKDVLMRALTSVYAQEFASLEVIVVDSRSTDGTASMVRERFPSAKLIRLPRNAGCPGGRNHIYANATGDFILNMDDDAYLNEGALKRLVETFNADDSIGILSMEVKFIGQAQTGVVDESWFEVGLFRGTASAVRRTMIEKIGDFPHHFFLFDEEQHLSIRALNAGYKIVHRPSCSVSHPIEDGTSGRHHDYYRYRNALLVVTELFPGWLFIKYLVLRIGSNAMEATRRRTGLQYLAAVAYVLGSLPKTRRSATPCSAESVRKFLRLRRLVDRNYGVKG